MKSLIVAFAALSVLLVGGCSTSGGGGDSSNPRHALVGISFSFDAHDVTDTTISIPIQITMLGSALNPDLIGAFEEPDSGNTYPFRDPITRVDLPITLPPKHTPYGAPIYMPPGEIISFTITATFYGRYGDVVLCFFRDSAGNELPGTRRTNGIYDQAIRNTPNITAPGTVTCNYTGQAQ